MKRNLRDANERGQYVTELDRQYRNGRITHQQLLDRQNAAMPTCDVCHRMPSVAKRETVGYVCAACYEANR